MKTTVQGQTTKMKRELKSISRLRDWFGWAPRPGALAGLAMSVASAILSATFPLAAATSNIVFNGTISSAGNCAITVRYDGTLGVSANLRQLSSKITGGSEASADIFMSGRHLVSVDTPGVFAIAPNGADTGVTRTASWSGNILPGGTSWPERTTPLGFIGTGSIRTFINYVADRPAAFPSGHYQAISVIRCEAY
jgi:hypothetical protein